MTRKISFELCFSDSEELTKFLKSEFEDELIPNESEIRCAMRILLKQKKLLDGFGKIPLSTVFSIWNSLADKKAKHPDRALVFADLDTAISNVCGIIDDMKRQV